jgi:RNA polymerase sigma factor (sigma-70 family)
MQQRSDEELMAALVAGDTAALELLVQRHHHLLLGYLYRFLGGDRTLAEDLVQETFLRVIQHMHQSLPRSFKAWLYAIATNLARDHHKSAARNHVTPCAEQVLLLMQDPAPGPEDVALATEQEYLLLAALSQISEDYRATLLLRYYNGLRLHEIADTLHIPLGTVKSRLSTGLRQMREVLEVLKVEVR